jgi:hypothetical protein
MPALWIMKVINLLIDTNKWVKLFTGALLFAAVIILINKLNLEESPIVKQLIIPLAVPGAYALMGLLEITTGVPFKEISGRWDSLARWQRGLLGIIVAILSFVLLIYGIVLFA